jgi:hypothetical protein
MKAVMISISSKDQAWEKITLLANQGECTTGEMVGRCQLISRRLARGDLPLTNWSNSCHRRNTSCQSFYKAIPRVGQDIVGLHQTFSSLYFVFIVVNND